MECEPTTSQERSRKRCRPQIDLSLSSGADLSDDEIDPFISDKDRSESIEGTSEDEGLEPLAKRKFIPTEETKTLFL